MGRASRRVREERAPATPRRPPLLRTDRRIYLLIFAVALGLRLAASWTLGSLPISRTPWLDSAEYLLWARRIVETGFHWPPFPSHGPGYPFFLAALLAVFDGSLMVIRIVQSALGALTCVLTGRLAARTLAPGALLPAGLLHACYGPLVYVDTALLAEPLFLFLVLLALNVAIDARGLAGRWVAVGVATGAAAIVRPTALVLLPACAAVLLWRPATRRAAFPALGALAFGTALVVGPVVVQNWRVGGVPLIQAYGGMNVYLGNSPAGDGTASARPGGGWDRLEGEPARAGVPRHQEDRYFLRKALAEIHESPVAYLRLLATKVGWTLQAGELRDTHSYYFFRDAFPLLKPMPGFGLLLALALVGAIGLRHATAPSWIVATIAAFLPTLLFLVVGTRYRIPLVPPLAALAGFGIFCAIGWIRSRQWRDVAAAAILFAVVLIGAHLRTHAASRNLAEEWAFSGLSLLHEGDADGAEASYRHAIAVDSESSFGWHGLGLTLHRRGSLSAAADAFDRAVTLNPDNALAWAGLGQAREAQRQTEVALEAYRRAVAIAPGRTDFIEMLGNALFAAGEFEEAEPLLRTVAERTPAHGPVRRSLAFMALHRGDPASALPLSQEAARLMPHDRLAWELLARVAIQAGETDEAERALERAERLGVHPSEALGLRIAIARARGWDAEVERLLNQLARLDPEAAAALKN